jgi:hypothetical protein
VEHAFGRASTHKFSGGRLYSRCSKAFRPSPGVKVILCEGVLTRSIRALFHFFLPAPSFTFHRICLHIPSHSSASFDDKPNRRTIRRTRSSVEATEIGFT